MANVSTADDVVPVWERERRRLMTAAVISCVLYVGNTCLGQVAVTTLRRDLTVSLSTVLALQVAGWPESIRIVLVCNCYP